MVAQQPALVHVERGDHHDLVAVDERAALIDREHPVGITVERQTGMRAGGDDRGLQVVR